MTAERIIRKKKTMVCGHEQTFHTPVPQPGEIVFCLTCNSDTIIPKRKYDCPYTVAEGRSRRLKVNPRSNNQYTKGRTLSG